MDGDGRGGMVGMDGRAGYKRAEKKGAGCQALERMSHNLVLICKQSRPILAEVLKPWLGKII